MLLSLAARLVYAYRYAPSQVKVNSPGLRPVDCTGASRSLAAMPSHATLSGSLRAVFQSAMLPSRAIDDWVGTPFW